MGYLPSQNMLSKMKKSQNPCQSLIVDSFLTNTPIRKYTVGGEYRK